MSEKTSYSASAGGRSAPQVSIGAAVILALSLSLVFFLWLQNTRNGPTEISYPEFKSLVVSNQVARITLFGDRVYGLLDAPMALGDDYAPTQYFETWLPGDGDASLPPLLARHSVRVTIRPMVSPI